MKSGRRGLLGLIVGYAAYCTVYLCRLNLTIAGPAMEAQGLLTAAQYGLMGSVFSIAYSIGRLFFGAAGDRMRRHRLVAGGLLITGASNIAIGLTMNMTLMPILWAINGCGQSLIWGALLSVVSSRFEEKKRSYIGAVLVSSVQAGSVMGILLAMSMVSGPGTPASFIVPGALGVLLAAVTFVCLWDAPRPRRAPGERRRLPLKELAPHLTVAFLNGCVKDNVSYWAAMLFLRAYQIDLSAMTGFVLLVPVLGLIGRFVYPVVYRLVGEREKRVSFLGFVLCAAASVGLMAGGSAVLSAVCLCVIAAAMSLVNTSLVIYPLQVDGGKSVSTLGGLFDLAVYMGSGLSAMAYGWLLDATGMNFTWMFLSWLLISALGLVLCRQGRTTQQVQA